MPASASRFYDTVYLMDSLKLTSNLGTGVKQTVIEIDEYADLGQYTEENPFFAYFYLYEEKYDYTKYEAPDGADPLVNLNFLYFDAANYMTYRWGGGCLYSPVQHKVQKYYNNSPVTLWTAYTYAEPFKACDELFIQMWYNETTNMVTCRIRVNNALEGYVPKMQDFYIKWGGQVPKIRLIVRDCSVTVKYAFGEEARALYALANVEEIFQQGKTAGYQQGYDTGWTSGEESGYNKGYDVGANEGYNEGLNAGELAGYDKGYSKGHDDGFVEGFSQGGADSIKGLANYCEAQGITFVDPPSSIEAIYKAIKDRGWTEAADQGTLTTKLIFTALEAPINVVLGAANFEVFGINFAGVTFAILAGVLVLFILRVIIDIIV